MDDVALALIALIDLFVLIQRLHALAPGGLSGDAGLCKQRDDEIVEVFPSGERSVWFVTTPAKDTPKTIAVISRSKEIGGRRCLSLPQRPRSGRRWRLTKASLI